MTDDQGDTLTMAVYEAMANIVAHAYPCRTGVFDLHATHRAEHRQVIVTDHGQPTHTPSPGLLAGLLTATRTRTHTRRRQ